MKLSCNFLVALVSFEFGRKVTDVSGLSVDSYLSSPAIAIRPGALQVLPVTRAIHRVLAGRGEPQVAPAIVGRVPVDVIDHCRWVLSRHPLPDDSMGLVLPSLEHHLDMTPTGVYVPCDRSLAHSRSANGPCQLPTFWAVVEVGVEVGLAG